MEIWRLVNDYLMPVAMARKRAYEAAGREAAERLAGRRRAILGFLLAC